VLDELKQARRRPAGLMITAFASMENAIAAMKRGAFDYITKPFKNDEVLVVLRNAIERGASSPRTRAQAEPAGALPQVREHHRPQPADEAGVRPHHPGGAEPLDDPDHRRERHRQGAGRARDPHATRPADKSFVTVNSGQPAARPARVDAVRPRQGRLHRRRLPEEGPVRLADKGSIFFDEIGNIPLETQAKLLRVMQEREFMRLGGVETIKVDVRIIAATNVDLRAMVEEGKFREDLFYRLHVISVSCRRCASARTTFRCSCSTSSRSTARRTAGRGSSSRPKRSTC
jgi:two-component system, NtrC family, response regulator PilR